MPNGKKNLVVKIDEQLHKEMKVYVASKGITIQEYIENLIRKDIKSNN